MRVDYKAGLYYLYDADPLQAEGWGFQWRMMLNAWVTSKITVAAKARKYCVGAAKTRVDAWLSKRAKAVEASHALDADVDIPAPPGCVYRPYQRAGIAFALQRHSTLIADSMRLGKTMQAIGVGNATPDLKRLLVVCPATAKINWQRELTKWLVHDLPIGIVEGSDNPEAAVTIINYDILTRHTDFLLDTDWDIVTFDEAHYLKNERSQRTAVALGDVSRPKESRRPIRANKHRLFLTGTPLYTRPIDLWTVIKACDPNDLGKSYWNFVTRYCGTDPDMRPIDTSGASNLEELQFKMRSSFMIRREKTDVAEEIPPNRNTVVLPRAGLERIVAAEQSAIRANLGRFEEMLARQMTEELADDIIAQFSLQDGIERGDDAELIVANTDVASARRELALAKLPMCLAHLDRVLEVEPKIIIFAHHRDVVKKLREHYSEAAVLIGGLTPTQRQTAIDTFVNDPKCRVFIGNIQAAGQAIDLSVADYVAFVELSWVPSEMDQAEERAWDVLKTTPVSIDRFVVEGTSDEAMCAVLNIRQKNIEKAMKVKSLENFA